MKTLKYYFIAALAGFTILSACNDDLVIPKPQFETGGEIKNDLDTIEYKVYIYADRPSVDRLGGTDGFKLQLVDLFHKATIYWNESSHKKLKHYTRYTAAYLDVYEGSSQSQELRNTIYNGTFDFSKYDVIVFFDLFQDNGETGNGGAAHGNGSNSRSVVTVFAGPGEEKNIFTDNTYRTLVHEFGHYRGVTDMYQYVIASKDNPVNNISYEPPKCIMWNAADGVWSDYAAKIINYTAQSKQIGKDYDDFFGSLYPKNIEITVLLNGKPKRGIPVKLYGSRAGGSTHGRDVWPEAFKSYQTDKEGKILITNVRDIYIPDRKTHPELPESLPYGRWFSFIVEASYGSVKKYGWLPEYEIQMGFFEEDQDTYKLTIAF